MVSASADPRTGGVDWPRAISPAVPAISAAARATKDALTGRNGKRFMRDGCLPICEDTQDNVSKGYADTVAILHPSRRGGLSDETVIQIRFTPGDRGGPTE